MLCGSRLEDVYLIICFPINNEKTVLAAKITDKAPLNMIEYNYVKQEGLLFNLHRRIRCL